MMDESFPDRMNRILTQQMRDLGSMGIVSLVMSDKAFDILADSIAREAKHNFGQKNISGSYSTEWNVMLPVIDMSFVSGSVKIYRENPYKL